MTTETTQLNVALAAELTKRDAKESSPIEYNFSPSMRRISRKSATNEHLDYIDLFTISFDTLRLLEDLLTDEEFRGYRSWLGYHASTLSKAIDDGVSQINWVTTDSFRLSALDRCRALVRVLDLKIEGGVK